MYRVSVVFVVLSAVGFCTVCVFLLVARVSLCSVQRPLHLPVVAGVCVLGNGSSLLLASPIILPDQCFRNPAVACLRCYV